MHQLTIKTRFVDASDTYAARLENCAWKMTWLTAGDRNVLHCWALKDEGHYPNWNTSGIVADTECILLVNNITWT
jgi:hypothetical protein